MEKTMKVTGKGKLSVKPDLIRLLLDVQKVCETYEEALRESTAQTEHLKDSLEGLGFARTDLKTLRFHVDTEYENYRDENNVWKNRFLGYKFTHAMKLEFDADNRKLGQVLYALAHAEVHPEIHINYTIKDAEAAKNRLLAKAAADSKEKAKVLAEAAGVTLGDIVKIDYSWDEIEFISRPVERCMTMSAKNAAPAYGYSIDIEPDDIDVTDTVTVMWEIG
ncbi:MAG: SIMPL domain-containing protein [Lachnospiraceae bacterium]|nr:SIMPL domain-containing protein [Lachnospiraceae bacterium]